MDTTNPIIKDKFLLDQLYAGSSTNYGRFISLLDTPAEYESGRLLILDSDKKIVAAVELQDVPSLDDGVIKALQDLLADSDTISFYVDTDRKIAIAQLNNNCVAPINIRTTNQPQENNVLVYTEGSFEWRHSAEIINIEAQVDIAVFQPVTDAGYIAKAVPPITNRAVGLAITAAVANAYVRVQTGSVITNPYWSWNVGANIFLQNDGTLSEIPPSTGFIQVIGNAVKPDTILLLQYPVVIL